MQARYRIQVFSTVPDPRSEVICRRLILLGHTVTGVHLTDNYLVDVHLTGDEPLRVAGLLVQPVTQDYRINEPWEPASYDFAVDIAYLPGVTDNVSHTVRESIEDLLKDELDNEKSVFSSVTYFFAGVGDFAAVNAIAAELHNPLIQRARILSAGEYRLRGGMGNEMPIVSIHEDPVAEQVDLSVPESELMAIAREGIKDPDGTRRGPLALDMASMEAIREYFLGREKRNPTDIELESIAQTWSEHCKHTIFAAEIDDDVPEGIFKHYIREATVRIRREKGDRDFCVSVFTDNAGGIEFDDTWVVADKVETHNSPSALDPFGGSITGIVGVNRDAIGFGMGSKPVANRYGFCFANPFDEKPLFRDAAGASKMLSPRRIMEGVIHGVNVGGNTSGIPTPQGFVYFDDRFKGKPLVFVGTVGLIPRSVGGRSSVSKRAMSGDNIVIVGGRVGRDGIHGATFSSEALSSGSPVSAVQIGDPITQKKLSDAIVKEARDAGLYHSITDNGAGGISCSVAEMARECGGFTVALDLVPLKYPGLSPWQIWVSESQERMTLSVPDKTLDAFLGLMHRRGVEATVIGRFNDTSRGVITWQGARIFDLDMGFLHDGLPRKRLSTTYRKNAAPHPAFTVPADMGALLRDMMGRMNLAGFSFITTQYDHEVQGSSVIKPLQGRGAVNGTATVIRPVLDSPRGVVLSQGLYPSYSDIDTYRMAACSIDTAVRNAVAVGGSIDRMAILDNFCWCDSTNPERLGQLKEAARACYDTAVAYGTPFVSGKDSMFNDFRGYDDALQPMAISIPPTLLISSIGVIDDIMICQTMDFKAAGDIIFIVGLTADETGGSEYLAQMGEQLGGSPYRGDRVPQVDPESFARGYRAVQQALCRGLVASSASVERGGLGCALVRSALAGMRGCRVALDAVPGDATRDDYILFAESQGRLLLSVAPGNRAEFEQLFRNVPFSAIGTVIDQDRLAVTGTRGGTVIDVPLDELSAAYHGRFAGF